MFQLKNIGSTLVLLASAFGIVAEANAETVNIFGLEHTALGSANLTVNAGPKSNGFEYRAQWC